MSCGAMMLSTSSSTAATTGYRNHVRYFQSLVTSNDKCLVHDEPAFRRCRRMSAMMQRVRVPWWECLLSTLVWRILTERGDWFTGLCFGGFCFVVSLLCALSLQRVLCQVNYFLEKKNFFMKKIFSWQKIFSSPKIIRGKTVLLACPPKRSKESIPPRVLNSSLQKQCCSEEIIVFFTTDEVLVAMKKLRLDLVEDMVPTGALKIPLSCLLFGDCRWVVCRCWTGKTLADYRARTHKPCFRLDCLRIHQRACWSIGTVRCSRPSCRSSICRMTGIGSGK